MSMCLQIANISKSFGLHHGLNDVSFTLNMGERVGLVGANGVGKSTLFKIITGELEPDSGTVAVAADARLGYLAQTLAEADDKTLADLIGDSLRYVNDLEARLRELERVIAGTVGDELAAALTAYGETADQFERAGGYDLDYRVDTVFAGLCVDHLARTRLFGTLSGGEQTRVGLALLLLGSPDVLLLDEPTNHLDAASLDWLENYLAAYRGALLMISHDRTFLNRTVNAIIELDEHTRTAKRYAGDYDAYAAAKAGERRKWRLDYARQQDEIKALRLEVKETARRNDNFRVHRDNDKLIINKKRTTHQQTVSHRVDAAREKLKRIEAALIPEPPDDLRFRPAFDPDALKGRAPLFVSGVSKAYDGRTILSDVHFTLGVDSRVVLVGENGAGKSTLLRMLAGEEKPDAGEIYIHPAVHIGYLDQNQAALDRTQTVFEAYRAGLPESDQALKALLLKSGLFRYEDLGKHVGELSSGQARKLQLARLIAGRANLLMLDEPTNAFSFDVVEALENALRDFSGAVIAASHDRRFIAHFGGEVWEVKDGVLNRNPTEVSAQSTLPGRGGRTARSYRR